MPPVGQALAGGQPSARRDRSTGQMGARRTSAHHRLARARMDNDNPRSVPLGAWFPAAVIRLGRRDVWAAGESSYAGAAA